MRSIDHAWLISCGTASASDFSRSKRLRGVYPQIEPQRFVNAEHTFVTPFEAPDVAPIQVTQAKAPVAMLVSVFDDETDSTLAHLA